MCVCRRTKLLDGAYTVNRSERQAGEEAEKRWRQILHSLSSILAWNSNQWKDWRQRVRVQLMCTVVNVGKGPRAKVIMWRVHFCQQCFSHRHSSLFCCCSLWDRHIVTGLQTHKVPLVCTHTHTQGTETQSTTCLHTDTKYHLSVHTQKALLAFTQT